jgi:hypothetical protein
MRAASGPAMVVGRLLSKRLLSEGLLSVVSLLSMVREMRQRRLTVLALCMLTGCLWRGYAAIMAVHLDVLTQTAAKLCAVVESGRGLTTEGMAEYVYPAQRAREFLHQFSGQSGRESYKRFATLVDRYEAMVREVDAARAAERDWKPELPHLNAEREALAQLAADVRADLKREV